MIIVEREFLTICWEPKCEKIRISDRGKIWLAEEDNPVLYQKFMKRYGKDRLSHGCCDSCLEVAMKEVDDFFSNDYLISQ